MAFFLLIKSLKLIATSIGLADVENLKKACNRAKALIETNECFLTKTISSELYPIYQEAFEFKVYSFELFPAINALKTQIEKLLCSGRQCVAFLKPTVGPDCASWLHLRC